MLSCSEKRSRRARFSYEAAISCRSVLCVPVGQESSCGSMVASATISSRQDLAPLGRLEVRRIKGPQNLQPYKFYDGLPTSIGRATVVPSVLLSRTASSLFVGLGKGIIAQCYSSLSTARSVHGRIPGGVRGIDCTNSYPGRVGGGSLSACGSCGYRLAGALLRRPYVQASFGRNSRSSAFDLCRSPQLENR